MVNAVASKSVQRVHDNILGAWILQTAEPKHFLKLSAISRLRRLTLFPEHLKDTPAVFLAKLSASA
jgi:hypothetical protein